MQEYQMDLEAKSYNGFHTPTESTKKLPLVVQNTGYFYAREGYRTEREGMQSYLLFYTLSGEGLLRAGGREYRLAPGTFAMLDCMPRHFYRTLQTNWDFYWIHFSGQAAKEYFELFCSAQGERGLVCPVELPQFAEQMRELIFYPYEPDLQSGLKTCLGLTELLTGAILEAGRGGQGTAKRHRREIAKAAEYMKEHFTQNMTLDDIQRQVYLSKYYFLRLFKQTMGQTPLEYLTHCRVNHAKRLLRETALTVEEIGRQSGFGNASYFIRTFKKLTGSTPGEYRNDWS